MEGIKLHSVSFAEFDIDAGNTLTHRYPPFKLDDYDDEYLGNCCLPDGGHIHSEDRTFLILQIKQKKMKQKSKDKKSSKRKKEGKEGEVAEDDAEVEEKILYGVSYFMSRHDKTVKRGAIQKSILLLSWQPHFELYYSPAKATLERYLDDKTGKEGKQLLKTLYDSIILMGKTQNFQLNLWGANYPINVPVLAEDQFEGVSLVELINRFQVNTILLWYSILMQKKILFVGQPARDVGNCALVTPLLVSPFFGFTKIITPYVALTDISPVLKPTFICGTTNLLFETKTEWWDTLGSFASGSVITNIPIKVASSDKEFMKNIISGIQDNRGEQWVRQQFKLFTFNFLLQVEGNTLKKEHKKYFGNFKENPIYKRYKASIKNEVEKESKDKQQTPFQLFQELKNGLQENSEGVQALSKVHQKKMLYELSNNLQDLTHIEEICDSDGVSVLGLFLNDPSVQVRKYAVVVLAQLATSLKGQIMISMMSDQILARVIEMLKDSMLNVANAAGCCLLKIATLYSGVQTLVSHGVHSLLIDLICNGNLDLVMKTQCMATLLQIYKYAPNTTRPNGSSLHGQLKSPDKNYRSTVLQLLDLWNEDLPQVIQTSPKVEAHIKALQSNMEDSEQGTIPDLETRITSSTFFLSDIVKSAEIIYEFVEAGGVEVIAENLKIVDINQRLPKYSYSILTIVVDSNFGRKRILKNKFIIENAINSLESVTKPILIVPFIRFLEVCSQHKDTASFILEYNGLSSLLSFLVKSFMTKQKLLCIPLFAILRQLLFLFPNIMPDLSRSDAMPIFLDILKDKNENVSEDEINGMKKLKELSYSILVFLSENTPQQ